MTFPTILISLISEVRGLKLVNPIIRWTPDYNYDCYCKGVESLYKQQQHTIISTLTMSAPASPTKSSNFTTPFSSTSGKPRHVIGICALEAKSRSKPMRNILDRLLASNSHPTNPIHFELILFTDQMILNEPITQWPNCDALISFYSIGFPLEKAIAYQKQRGVFCVNDLVMQWVLQDRRLTQLILEAIDVPTPKRIWLNHPRDSPPSILSPELNEIVSRDFNVDLSSSQYYKRPVASLTAHGIRVGREMMPRPFIEKPTNADDHNIWIYEKDGMVCKLFRKIANKSSERVPEEDVKWRGSLDDSNSCSLVYEEFLPVDSGEDVKVYTVGPNYAYAESRKSPFIDGVVRRNAQGKEIRIVTQLTEEEQEIARRVCMAFGQTVCGFDMIRSDGKSYVIDVNGWSFVKGSETYYDKAAKILKDTFIQIARRRRRHSALSGSPSALLQAAPLESDFLMGQWRLKAYVGVFRHADRTPKQKLKVYAKHPKLFEFFLNNRQGDGKIEITLRNKEELEALSKICKEIVDGDGMHHMSSLRQSGSTSANSSIYSDGEFLESTDSMASSVASFRSLTLAPGISSLKQIIIVLEKKIKVPGTKVQIRQQLDDHSSPSNLQIILKWGGEFTHAGRHQSKDAGENLRKDLMILNKRILDDVRVYSSTERRVQATAQVFSKAFFPIAELPDNFVTTSAELLDDNLVEKKLFDSVKQRIRSAFRDNPLVIDILKALKRHRRLLNENYVKLEEQMKRWCCSESPILFKERWDKHFIDVLGAEEDSFILVDDEDHGWNADLSRINDLYDSIRYDAIHHRQFLIQMFVGLEGENAEEYEKNQHSLIKLFDDLHKLFRLITPLEYGFTRGERLKISKQISGKLLEKVSQELSEACEAESTEPFVRLFFTKETHMHALMNLIRYSGIPLSKTQGPASIVNASMTPIIPNMATTTTPNTPKTEQLHMSDSEDEDEYEDVTRDIVSNLGDEVDLDYLSQICFEFYEKVKPTSIAGHDSRSYSLRIGISKGAHDAHLFDLQMDAKHAVTVKGRTWITEYLDGEQVLEWFQSLVK